MRHRTGAPNVRRHADRITVQGERRAASSRFRIVLGGAVKGGTAFYDDRKRKKAGSLGAVRRHRGISLTLVCIRACGTLCHARKRV